MVDDSRTHPPTLVFLDSFSIDLCWRSSVFLLLEYHQQTFCTQLLFDSNPRCLRGVSAHRKSCLFFSQLYLLFPFSRLLTNLGVYSSNKLWVCPFFTRTKACDEAEPKKDAHNRPSWLFFSHAFFVALIPLRCSISAARYFSTVSTECYQACCAMWESGRTHCFQQTAQWEDLSGAPSSPPNKNTPCCAAGRDCPTSSPANDSKACFDSGAGSDFANFVFVSARYPLNVWRVYRHTELSLN
jgi:hypothetical protein